MTDLSDMKRIDIGNGREMYQCENGGIYDATIGLWVQGPPKFSKENQQGWIDAMNMLDGGIAMIDEATGNRGE